MSDEKPIPTLPDGTRHGPVPQMQPEPVEPDPGRKPFPNPEKVGDNPVRTPPKDPFPEDGTITE